jgi:hypothetical protein
MTLRRKLAIALVLTVVVVAAYIGHAIFQVLSRIPEAYAAWDTGTLLVEYMKSHDRKWPSSWNDLLSMVRNDADGRITLHGAKTGDTNYALSLGKRVSIDWTFNPTRSMRGNPVTRPDGSRFRMVWAGAEPNDMVRDYLISSAKSNALKGR